MIKRYNSISLAFGIPGIILQAAGLLLMEPIHPDMSLLMLPGGALFMIGLAYYAKAKGRHPAWCLGLLILMLLSDKAQEE